MKLVEGRRYRVCRPTSYLHGTIVTLVSKQHTVIRIPRGFLVTTSSRYLAPLHKTIKDL